MNDMVIQPQLIDIETFLELIQDPAYVGRVFELVDGEMIEVGKPGGQHGVFAMHLGRHVANYVYENDLGEVTAAETGYILFHNPDPTKGDTYRGIDVAFVSKARIPDGMPIGPVPFGPDLAAEVISPGNSAADIHKKILELFNAGTELIWIVYPETRTVEVHTPTGAVTLDETKTLDGGTVLPGFKLPIRSIFSGK